MKSETLKLILGSLIAALGISFVCIWIIGAEIIIDQNGHVTIDVWKHPGQISFKHYYDCSDLGNDGWRPKTIEDDRELNKTNSDGWRMDPSNRGVDADTDAWKIKASTDLSDIMAAEKTPDDSPFVMIIKVNKIIVPGIEGMRLIFIGGITIEPEGVTFEPTDGTPESFLFQIPKASGLKVDSPFHIQYKRNGKWQVYNVFNHNYDEKRDDSRLKPGIMI